ncbi:MAG: EVE domain-containing protein [Bdellovibrionales bacterium RIFCSPHIGHO2_01_FULL_40_29]|nr:MAG: EVE domain-containing protein [Bdellovibrionales bacterium RIFCSPHIGHO2_01_FULL_40_29]OFZ32370.1 MAG: EVE domain-containing protein [Bdellovibrionales bacterium RIFCSPHIGHO2_02_FULL_40_15]
MKTQQNHTPKYWLMKSEPDVFGIDHLKKDKTTWWEGVRNYLARNYMMNEMHVGDQILFYHSNAKPSGIAGLAVVSHNAEPDQLQFNKKSASFEKRATREKPVWFCVQVAFQHKFKNFISLEEIKQDPQCSNMLVIRKGQRLSIQPVSEKDFLYLKKKGL